jgi:hypothetical protein
MGGTAAFGPAGAFPGGAGDPGPAQGFAPRTAGFGTLLDWGASQEIGFGLSLKTLAFSGRPAFWSAFLRFDAADFGREPAWAVDLSL